VERIGVRLDAELPHLIEEHGVPGAAVAVLTPDGVVETAAGVLSRSTGVAATTGSVFQIGSITKLWTTALVMRLVEEGAVDLDEPVRHHLPGFRTVDAAASARITPRHLLTHTAGFTGDAFTPTSRGDDAVARFVREVLPGLAQHSAPGERFSYSNSGHVVLGALAERLHGAPFRELVHRCVAEPLGLAHVAAVPEEALLHRAAVGHVSPDGSAPPEPVRTWNLSPSNAPAGTLLSTSARTLVEFARAHLVGGLLRESTVTRMWRPAVEVLDTGDGVLHWGLGWALYDWEGPAVVGHDGGTLGQYAFLRVVPDAGVAVALLTNGGNAAALHDAVLGPLLREVAGVRLPRRPVPPRDPGPVDAVRVSGHFDLELVSIDVDVDDAGRARAVISAGSPQGAVLVPVPRTLRLVPLDQDRFVSLEPEQGVHRVLAFAGGGNGRPATHLFYGGRMLPRAGRGSAHGR
jgi:CubicO group peptidase (beta-lactamase class C family)